MAEKKADKKQPIEANEELEETKDYAEIEYEKQTALLSQRFQSKIAFLEREGEQLRQELGDAKEQMKINKQIIKQLLDESKGFNQNLRYTFDQMEHEQQTLEKKATRLSEQRDALNAQILILQQIVNSNKENKDDYEDIYKDEIDDMKENLERKEYLLQLTEQRYSEFEKFIVKLAETDDDVRAKLNSLNMVPRDRIVSNVVKENDDLRSRYDEVVAANERLREELEELVNKRGLVDMTQEQLSIFQSKAPQNLPRLDLAKIAKNVQAEKDPRAYIQKLEQSVNYLNEKIQKSRIDFKKLKQENRSLKDSIENHLSVNEKLNQALKKSEAEVQEQERLLHKFGYNRKRASYEFKDGQDKSLKKADQSGVSTKQDFAPPVSSEAGKEVDSTFGDVSCILMAADTHNVGILDQGEDVDNLNDQTLVKGSPDKN